MPPADETHAHLATMLAEMDGRLQLLQQELDSLTPPAADTPQPERAARVRTPAAQPPPPADRPARPSSTRGRDDEADPPAGLRKRPARQLTAVQGLPAAATTAEAERRLPELVGQSSAPDAVARQTILAADQEARRVVADARTRIAEIGARTRALLEHSLSPPDATKTAPPNISRALRITSSAAPERREYEGAVTIEVGPFGDIVQLNEFERALSSVPGVEDVYIRTFERHHAHFELRVVERRLLIAELRARARHSLRVIEAEDHNIRLEIVTNETARSAS